MFEQHKMSCPRLYDPNVACRCNRESILNTFIVTFVQRDDCEPMNPKTVAKFVKGQLESGNVVDVLSVTEVTEVPL